MEIFEHAILINHFLLVIESLLLTKFSIGKKKNLFFIISFIQLYFFLSFRGASVGTDTHIYIIFFNEIRAGGHPGIELGNYFLFKMIGMISDNPYIVIYLYAATTLVIVFYCLHSMSDDFEFSIILFEADMFYLLMFNIMRQGLALSITLLSAKRMIERKWLQSIVLIIIATLFHSSSIFFLIIWILSKLQIKYTPKKFYATLLLSVVAIVLGEKITLSIMHSFSLYLNYLNTSYLRQGNWLHPLMFLLMFIFCAYYFFMSNDDSESINTLMWMMAIGLILYFASISVRQVLRLVYFYSISVTVLLPKCINDFQSFTIKKQWRLLVIILVSIYLIIIINRNGQGGMNSYKFNWQ